MLSKKLSLITGAASGIGLETAKLFAQEGATVIAIDINPNVHNIIADLHVTSPLKHSAYTCDISKSQNVQDLFKQIRNDYPEYKVPTIIVNSAGIVDDIPFLELNEDVYDKVLNVNLKGTFLVSQAACRELVANFDQSKLANEQSYATIINIASVAAKVGFTSLSSYSASKGGVESLTRTIAKEMAKYKIRCNSIAPGVILTPLTQNMQKLLDGFIATVPLERFGTPSDIANACLYLASGTSSFMTGASILIDGGFCN